MPHKVKIGKTTQNMAERMRQLSAHEGVPKPFQLQASFTVTDIDRAEREIHRVLQRKDLHDSKEFFRCEVQQAIDLVKEIVEGLGVTVGSRPDVAGLGARPFRSLGQPDSWNRPKTGVPTIEDLIFGKTQKSAVHQKVIVPDASSENLQMWLQEAKRGEVFAQYYIGHLYENGIDIQKDCSKAAYWYRAAADQGHTDAQWRFAWLCYLGNGIQRNSLLAKSYASKACAGGHKEACDLQHILERKRVAGPGEDHRGDRRQHPQLAALGLQR